MDVKAELCVANMNLNDIYNLRVGDVIDLNKPQDSDVAVHIEGHQCHKKSEPIHPIIGKDGYREA